MLFRDGCFGPFMTDRTQELRWTGGQQSMLWLSAVQRCPGKGKSVCEMLRRVFCCWGKKKYVDWQNTQRGFHGGLLFFVCCNPQHIKQNGYFGPLHGDLPHPQSINVL